MLGWLFSGKGEEEVGKRSGEDQREMGLLESDCGGPSFSILYLLACSLYYICRIHYLHACNVNLSSIL